MAELSLVLSEPHSSAYTGFAAELARAATRKGHDVTVFLMGDAVYTAWSHSLGELEVFSRPVTELSALAKEGKISLLTCSSCLKARGIDREDLVEGARATGYHALAKRIAEGRTTLVLMP